MKRAGALAGWEGQEERKGEGAAGAFCPALCTGRISGNCELGRTKQNAHEKVPLLASSKVLKICFMKRR